MKTFIILLLFSFFAFKPQANAQNAGRAPLPEDSIQALMKEHHVPALGIAVMKEGKLEFTKVYGVLSGIEAAPYNTIFNVASLTKPIVTMLTLKLVSAGKWNLDEPLYHYWVDPDVKSDPFSQKLTTRHVLSHQTGFVNWRWLHPTGKLHFDFEPGTPGKFQYSGEGFEYLKKALENKFRLSLDRLCDSLLFGPLRMKDSRLTWNSAVESRFAKWHDKEGANSYEIYKRKSPSAADDLLTTVEDYSRFGLAVLNGFDLPQTLFAQMVTPAAPISKNSSMGLGWELFKDLPGGEYAMLHTGSDKGVKTLILLFPNAKEGLVVFTNSDNGSQLYQRLITTVFGEKGAALFKQAQ